MHDLIINFTPTGMVPTKAMNPAVPISAIEIIEAAFRSSREGRRIWLSR